MVIWLIGLSGAGKTTISRLLREKLKPRLPNLVLLDGDEIRSLFPDVDHTVEGRRRNAERISTLSRFLAAQGIHVIAAVLSIFPEWRDWNRKNIPGYAEVYLKADIKSLKARDSKGLYRGAESGAIANVVGVQIPFPEPQGSNLVVDMSGHRINFEAVVDEILKLSAVREAIGGEK